MKPRTTVCAILAAVLAVAPCQRASAPLPVYAALALKCVATGVIGATAIIIYRCEPDYYLVRYKLDGEDTSWSCSQATQRTLAKTGGARCEGPWRYRDEPDFRAWANNKTPDWPMFPCGPLGSIPGPVRTNYAMVTLQKSYNGGNQWRAAGQVLIQPGDANWSLCLLGPQGTNGMTADEIRQVNECDEVIPNGVPDMADVKDFRVQGFIEELPLRVVRFDPRKIAIQTE